MKQKERLTFIFLGGEIFLRFLIKLIDNNDISGRQFQLEHPQLSEDCDRLSPSSLPDHDLAQCLNNQR